MKNLISSFSLLVCTLASTALADGVPVGTLNVNGNMVRQGVAPRLTWNIQYPETITDVVEIPPTDEIDPKTKLRVKISMIGVGLTDGRGVQYPSKSYIKFGNASWKHLFTGRGRDVRPGQVLITRTVQPGEKIQFCAKVDKSGYSYRYNNSSHIKVLKNGDVPPSKQAGYIHQSSVAEFLNPYVENGKLKLGAMDLIYVCELTHSSPLHFGYDMQDTIVLIQFEKFKN